MTTPVGDRAAEATSLETGIPLTAIDGCAHDFSTLSSTVLPAHFERWQIANRHPWSMAEFAQPGVGVRSLAKRFGFASDFSGCYVLSECDAPLYVGISRTVIGRLRQHVNGKSHFDASLAYRMACGDERHGKTRSQAMADAAFEQRFLEKRAYLRSLSVAAVAIENPVELYLFEIYAAMRLRTAKWNTFRTH